MQKLKTNLIPLLCSLFLVIFLAPSVAQAQNPFPGDSLQNKPISTAPRTQNLVRVVSVTNGTMHFWISDEINWRQSIMMQLLDGSGIDQLPVGGIPFDSTFPEKLLLEAVEDDFGGAIVVWVTTAHIRMQRFDAAGNRYWPQDGVVVDVGGNGVSDLELITDGNGNSYLAWVRATGASQRQIMLAHIYSNGVIDNVITVFSGSTKDNPQLSICRDNGVFICFTDYLNSYSLCQHVDSTMVPSWSNFTTINALVDIFPHANDGAFVFAGFHVLRLNDNGVVDWQANISNQNGPVYANEILKVDDGYLLAWAQGGLLKVTKIDSFGNFVWAMPTVVCNSGASSGFPKMVTNGNNGAIISWEENNGGVQAQDVYAAIIDSAGNMACPMCGIPVSVVNSDQRFIEMAPTYPGCAVIDWIDFRAGGMFPGDVYSEQFCSCQLILLDAQSLELQGRTVEEGVILAWKADGDLAGRFKVERSTDGRDFAEIAYLEAEGLAGYEYLDQVPVLGDNFYRVTQLLQNGEEIVSNTVLVYSTSHLNSGSVQIFPNPAMRAEITVKFHTAEQQELRLRIYNALGDLMTEESFLPEKQPGLHERRITLDGWQSGCYFLVVQGASYQEVQKFAIVH